MKIPIRILATATMLSLSMPGGGKDAPATQAIDPFIGAVQTMKHSLAHLDCLAVSGDDPPNSLTAKALALDSDRCVQILREAGHLDTTSVGCVVDLGNIPDGLNAAELERYLREHGAILGRR